MEVSFESTDPDLAARILNAHLKNFQEQKYQEPLRGHQARDHVACKTNWTNSRSRSSESENARIEYERKNQIWSVDDKNDKTMSPPSGSRDLNKELTDAQSDTSEETGALRICQIR